MFFKRLSVTFQPARLKKYLSEHLCHFSTAVNVTGYSVYTHTRARTFAIILMI